MDAKRNSTALFHKLDFLNVWILHGMKIQGILSNFIIKENFHIFAHVEDLTKEISKPPKMTKFCGFTGQSS